MFPSTTSEEAPVFFLAWLKQRTRWMKGWMQTWAVHMSSPIAFWRDVSWRGFLTINLLVGGNVLGALVYPVLLAELAIAAVEFASGQRAELFANWQDRLHLISILSGFVVTIVMGTAGLARRGLLGSVWILLLTPVYWMALSAAAWRALYQFAFDRFRWEKTEHGLSMSDYFKSNQQLPAENPGARTGWASRPTATG